MGAAGSAAHATPWETIFVAESAKPSTPSDVDDPLTEVIRLRKILYDGQKAVEAMQQEIDSRRSDGKVKLIYQQYQELFPITNGCSTIWNTTKLCWLGYRYAIAYQTIIYIGYRNTISACR